MSLHTGIKIHTSQHFSLFIMDSSKPSIQSLCSFSDPCKQSTITLFLKVLYFDTTMGL